MVSCIGDAHQVLIWPAIEVCVLPTDDAIASIARLALTQVHGVTVVAQVVALGILVAIVGPICAGVAGLAYLRVHIQMSTQSHPEFPDNTETRKIQIPVGALSLLNGQRLQLEEHGQFPILPPRMARLHANFALHLFMFFEIAYHLDIYEFILQSSILRWAFLPLQGLSWIFYSGFIYPSPLGKAVRLHLCTLLGV